MEIYKLNPLTQLLEEQIAMKEPDASEWKDGFDCIYYKNLMQEYKYRIENRKKYPHMLPPEWEGRELVEGKDFEFQYQFKKELDGEWLTIDEDWYGRIKEEYRRIVAIPIEIEHCNANSQHREEREEVELNNEDDIHIKYHDLNIKYMATLDKIVELETENFGLKQEIRNMQEEIYKYQQ